MVLTSTENALKATRCFTMRVRIIISQILEMAGSDSERQDEDTSEMLWDSVEVKLRR
jgi:hypothetical protein